mmetsp:Transcript_114388/g.323356  ORF Transcript_114388/g.323356 Transcript_114388/m.323356 type:complete len:214 (+) Transcript_114388:607-1248(+)
MHAGILEKTGAVSTSFRATAQLRIDAIVGDVVLVGAACDPSDVLRRLRRFTAAPAVAFGQTPLTIEMEVRLHRVQELPDVPALLGTIPTWVEFMHPQEVMTEGLLQSGPQLRRCRRRSQAAAHEHAARGRTTTALLRHQQRRRARQLHEGFCKIHPPSPRILLRPKHQTTLLPESPQFRLQGLQFPPPQVRDQHPRKRRAVRGVVACGGSSSV